MIPPDLQSHIQKAIHDCLEYEFAEHAGELMHHLPLQFTPLPPNTLNSLEIIELSHELASAAPKFFKDRYVSGRPLPMSARRFQVLIDDIYQANKHPSLASIFEDLTVKAIANSALSTAAAEQVPC